ncbi:MAG: mandelate racemase/muconate lactonizing enzyme family protein [Gemmataceae bacterium]|nr:mandelate racemase/muconate lactonizing enzyme family protein [Gemmataceae bacterium]
MQITDVRAVQLTRRLDRPQRNSREARSERTFTFVLVETDAGLTGLGDAYGDQALMPTIIERRLRPMAFGLDPCDVAMLWRRLFAARAFWETGGSVLCGISAIEVACWDIRGQAEGVGVCELLGGAKRTWIDAYASDLHWEEPARMAETAARFVEKGFRCLKTHLGAPGEWDRDLERVAAIRRAIGPDAGFMIDVNTVFEPAEALRFGQALVPFHPFWYEEPVWPVDAAGHAWLRAQLPCKIATGENLYLAQGFEPLWTHQACDYVMPDILRCGGLEQTRRICEKALDHDIIPSPHNFSSGVGLAATLHLMAALPATQWLEFDPTGTAIYEELFVEPLQVEAGRVRVPSTPGLGVRLTQAIINQNRS